MISPSALFWVFLGGGIGACMRFAIMQIVSRETFSNLLPSSLQLPQNFPYAILLVNVLGSFAIGLIGQIVSRETFVSYSFAHPFLIAGILGGFTTFSAFSIDTLALLNSGKIMLAFIYVTCSVVFSVFAAYLGYMLAK